jgi:predicted amidohydrolase YtcJ
MTHKPQDRTGISRRAVLKSSAAAGLAAALGGVTAGAAGASAASQRGGVFVAGAAPEDAAPELVLTNGRIHTMDGSGTVARSAAIRDGRFVAVGDGSPAGGPGVRVINLKGRTVVPGLTEPHVHIVSLANRPGYHTILENTTSIAEVQDALARRRADAPAGAWITSMGGFHTNQWAEHRMPTLAELDEAVPDRPVLLYTRFTGPCATNSLGKAFFDAADAGPAPHPAYVPVNTAADGTIAEGGFAGGASNSALYLLRTLQTFEDKRRSTLDAMAYSTEVGQ